MTKKILTSIDMAGNPTLGFTMETLASNPGGASTGQMWYNSTTGYATFWDGSANVQVASKGYVDSAVAGAGGGDMTTAVYDTDDDGKVNAADAADSAPWAGITGKPPTFTPSAHTHAIEDTTGLQSALDAKLDESAVSSFGATLIDDTTASAARTTLGLGALATLTTISGTQIDNATVANVKLANMAQATVKGRAAGAGTGVPQDLSVSELKTLLALAISDITGLQTALDAKAASSHTHATSEITDFDAEVESKIIAYWDEIAGSDASVDTIRETLDIVLQAASDSANLVKRHAEDIGDGSSTSIAVTHNFGSEDVHVFIKDNSTDEFVEADITVTSANVVTISFAEAPTTNAYRVIVKY